MQFGSVALRELRERVVIHPFRSLYSPMVS
jgi:hypothetical protein